jgi:predicted amino acid dehydrogenase
MEQAGKIAGVELEGVRLQVAGLSGKVTTIDGRLLSVETQVAALIARSAEQ